MTIASSIHEAGYPKLVLWDNPEGWDQEGGSGWGIHVHPWLIHVNVWQKPPQYCKVINLQLKFFKTEKKKNFNQIEKDEGSLQMFTNSMNGQKSKFS